MAEITLQGNKIHTHGTFPAPDTEAPDFTLVNKDLEDVSLKSFHGKHKLLSVVPSLDTPVCATSTKKFEEAAQRNPNAVFLIISSDLPFAMSRFCSSDNLNNVIPLSLMRARTFAKDYGVLIEDGPLAGITARAVIVIDENDVIRYAQLVEEIANEPDYEAAIKALSSLPATHEDTE